MALGAVRAGDVTAAVTASPLSGEREVFDAHREALERLGAAHFAGAEPGLAALLDIALLSGMYGLFSGVFHALALADSANVPAAEFVPLLSSACRPRPSAICCGRPRSRASGPICSRPSTP
ncbi:hypothetical protein ACFQ6V_15495 [Streptomyces roseifaciens]